ncbi:MAG TPA: prolyl oligopeptidase family serine peptidase [Thermoanaerobaculia bacterium]|nr:prolyl oligopeptidase family serine peptidase [Thermoanaerobaculia bacterium]
MNVRHIFLVLLTALALCGCTRHSQFLEREITVGDHTYKYRVWLPHHYTKLHRWPVVLYLHGSGERGTDNVQQVTVGLAPALERYGERYKVIAVFPQCDTGREWYGEMESMALAELNSVTREFHGDQSRVYLTGVSMGGAGTWYMARHNRMWAALLPVCGGVARHLDDPFPSDPPPDIARIIGARNPYATLAGEIGRTPVWAFHGAMDDIVPVTESRAMVAALRSAGGNVQYTEYANGGHDVWDDAYGDASMVKWMLQQKLR